MHKFDPMLQAMRISDAKAAVDKEWEKLEEMPAWQMTKVKSTKEVILEAQKRANNSPFCCADGHLSSQNSGSRTEISKAHEGWVVLRGDIVKNDSRSYAVFQ